MAYETYVQIIENADTCIEPGKSVSFTFDGSESQGATRLFLTGETNIDPSFKSEPGYEKLYRRIDDSLQSIGDGFCLDYSGPRCAYPKIAFKKVLVSDTELLSCGEKWSFGISAKACDLAVHGYLRLCVEIRTKKDGVDRHSTALPPDEVYTIDIPQGTYDWQALSQNIRLDAGNVANVCYILEGEDYEGEIFFEMPHFASQEGQNLVGQFCPHTENRDSDNWMGQNLSHIEWIGLKVELNGNTVFDGEIFERCHRFSEAELPLSADAILPGENTISITCTSHDRNAAGYVLRELGFLTERESAVISVPECITLGKPFALCVEGKKDERVTFSSDTLTAADDLVLQQDGLNALRFVCNTPANNLTFTLNGEECTIHRCVERGDDAVVTGSGDMVYIPIDENSITHYLKWYLSQNIGNLFTIRPTYRWNGTRVFHPELYQKLAAFLDAMGICYSHMLDGRELPGCNANPTCADVDGKHFLGRQRHEFDGQYVYWGEEDVTNNLTAQMFYDLMLRMYREYPDRMSGEICPENIHYTPKKQSLYRSPNLPTGMEEAANSMVQSLQNTRKGVLRHTGPSCLFKYFYQAGYQWLGAELMYGPMELTISALRGARDVYGDRIGAHLAVQWSTTPHDTESRYRRYRLALYICYMQGIDEINTEEGFWRLEYRYYFHNRFSPACQNHTLQQQDFYRYLSTHTRRGHFYTPIAFLSGRYDGWRCFGRGDAWGVKGFGFSDAERAWDLLTCFYPKSVLSSIYIANCPDKEVGYYSGTPNGNVDILPMEAEDFSKYRLLIALGYNKATGEDMEKLERFVRGGGTLLLGWPQLSETTDRSDVVSYKHNYLVKEQPNFTEDSYQSQPLHICEDVQYDSVLVWTDSHKPLVVLKELGEGTVCFVNAKEYAGAPAVELACREAIDLLTENCPGEEKIYAKGSRNVQFSVFELENGGREIYFIATDWHKENPDGEGSLVLGAQEYPISVPWGQLVKVTAFSESALYPLQDENEVIFFDGVTARLQGKGLAEFVLCKDGQSKTFTVDFSKESVREISLADL